MVTRIDVHGRDEFLNAVKTVEKGKQVIALFCGGKDANGVSWCPDCVLAMPVVEKVLQEHGTSDHVFIYVDVGDRTTWKNKEHPLRTDPQFRLTGVPTLMMWGTPKRLVEAECADPKLVELFFED